MKYKVVERKKLVGVFVIQLFPYPIHSPVKVESDAERSPAPGRSPGKAVAGKSGNIVLR